MKDQEYYDYSKDDGRDSHHTEEPKEEIVVEEPQQQDSSPLEPQEEQTKPKKKGCLGCYVMIISIVMIVVGLVTIITARSSAPEKAMPIDVQGKKIVIVEDVNPDMKYGISMKVTLAGKHYYTYTRNVSKIRHGRTRSKTVTSKSLVFQVPYSVKATRESNGEVVYEINEEFTNGTDKKVKRQSEYLKNSPSFSRDIPKFDFNDKVRFEFIVKADEKYRTVVEEGEVSVYQLSDTRNVASGISFIIVLLGFFGLTIGFIVAIIQFFILAAKQKKIQQKTEDTIDIEV